MSDDVERLVAEVEDLRATVRALDERLADVADTEPAHTSNGAGADQWEPAYPTLMSWVNDWFLTHVERGRRARWCERWFEHPEALWRLEGLWRTFEQARLDPWAGPASWTTGQLDPQVAVLLDDRGPFGECSPGVCAAPRTIGAER